MNSKYIIFTDLDATLLDHFTYSYDAAKPALKQINKNKIPLILTSSKTSEEMIYYLNKLELQDLPFIVENGSAVFTAAGYFKNFLPVEKRGKYDVYTIGDSFEQIKNKLEQIAAKYDIKIRGFHDATIEEIQQKTDLSTEAIKRSMQREFSIPVFDDKDAEKVLRQEARNYSLQINYGGRFMHLMGISDKGMAMQLILNGFAQKQIRFKKSIALGDSLNDFPMLKLADIAVLIKKHDGSFERRENLDNVIYSKEIGPQGWNQTILEILQEGV